jgi:hypothetical protein
MEKTIAGYRSILQHKTNIMYHSTVAIIPYTSKPGSLKTKNKKSEELIFIQELRLLWLQATVLSISQYFEHVVVTACSEADYADVKEIKSKLDVPIWKVVDFTSAVNDKPMLLPRETMLYVHRKFKLPRNLTSEDKVWARKSFIYYSESDQILHARGLRHLYRMLMTTNGSISIAPHRLIVSL